MADCVERGVVALYSAVWAAQICRILKLYFLENGALKYGKHL